MSSELRGIAGVSEVGAHVGRAVYGDQVVGINSAELWMSLDPKANYDATVSAIQGAVDGYTGMVREVRTYTQQILSQPLRSSTTDDVTLRLYGENQKVLRAEAAKLEKSLAGTSGVVDSHVILPADEPTLEIEVDLAAARNVWHQTWRSPSHSRGTALRYFGWQPVPGTEGFRCCRMGRTRTARAAFPIFSICPSRRRMVIKSC